MPPVPYMRQQVTRQLRLDLLLREASIQSEYGYSYADEIAEKLREAAVLATDLLAETLRMPVVPVRKTLSYSIRFASHIWLLPGRTLGLTDMAQLDDTGTVTAYDTPNRYAIMGDEFVGYRGRNGRFEAGGLWGIVEPTQLFGVEYETTEAMPAGGTTPAWDVSGCAGGELFLWEPETGEAQVFCLRSDKTMDPWLCPSTEVPAGGTVTCLGRISATVERLIALEAYFRVWQELSPVPEASQLVSETSGKHSYQRNTAIPKAFGVDLAEELHALRVRVRRMYGTQLLRTGQA